MNKPYGVSGIIRCYNCASTLNACVKSCVSAVDELILIYQDSTGSTLETMQEMAEIYSTKIRIIVYDHYVFPLDLDESQFKIAFRLPSDSPHLFASLTNYAIERIRFSHFVLLDSDQIYFTDKLSIFCSAYRGRIPLKAEICPLSYGSAELDLNFANWETYTKQILHKISAEKISVALSGINLYRCANKWSICLGDADKDYVYDPFNGVGDAFFGEASERCTMTFAGRKQSGLIHYIEYFPRKRPICLMGFFWFHLKPALQMSRAVLREYWEKNQSNFVPADMAKNGFGERRLSLRPKEIALSVIFEKEKFAIPWEMLNFLPTELGRSIINGDSDFIIEYDQVFNTELDYLVNALKENGESVFCVDNVSFEQVFKLYVYYKLFHCTREEYIVSRKNGIHVDVGKKNNNTQAESLVKLLK